MFVVHPRRRLPVGSGGRGQGTLPKTTERGVMGSSMTVEFMGVDD